MRRLERHGRHSQRRRSMPLTIGPTHRADTQVCPYKFRVFIGCRGEPMCSPWLKLMALNEDVGNERKEFFHSVWEREIPDLNGGQEKDFVHPTFANTQAHADRDGTPAKSPSYVTLAGPFFCAVPLPSLHLTHATLHCH